MATFGNTAVPTSDAPCSTDRIWWYKTTLSVAADVTQVTAVFGFPGSGSVAGDNGKAVIYLDNAGAPGTRKGVSSAVAIPGGNSQTVNFPLVVSLPAGDYWLGIVTDSFNSRIGYTSPGGVSGARNESLTYATPADPAGAPAATSTTDAFCVYATYTATLFGPTINTQPTPQTGNVGGTATFTIAATTSGGALSYQWKDDGTNVGSNSNSYTTGTLTNADQWAQITCVVTDDNGSATSTAAKLTVAFTVTGTGPRRRNIVGAYPVGTLRWLGVAAGSGSTGTLATTNANDTLAASGTNTITGTVARTNANDTLAASGSTTITGTVATTNADDTLAASGVIGGSTGTLSYTNANDTLAGVGTTTVGGTLARTNANDSLSASGSPIVSGTLATTNANDTLAATGTNTITGTVATTNADDTLAASGAVGGTVTGAVAVTNNDDTLAASGFTTITGALSYTNNNDLLAASGTVTPPPTTENPHLIWGVGQWNRKIRGKQVPDEVAIIIEEVVAAEPIILADTGKPSAYIHKRTLEQQEARLRLELKDQNIAWRKIYRDALVELLNQQNEDESIMLLMMSY